VRRSIRVRLLVWVLALVVPLSLLAGWLLVEVFGNRLLHDFDVALQEEAETIAELLATHESPNAVANLVAEIAGESDRGANKYIVVTRQGQVIAQAPRTAPEVLGESGAARCALRLTGSLGQCLYRGFCCRGLAR